MSCCHAFDRDDEAGPFKKRSLRDAVLCIGWFKMMSVIFYVTLYYLTKFYSHGALYAALLVMTLIGIIPSVFLGIMLFLGGIQECAGAVLAGLIVCYLLATYDLVVGMIGAGYHVALAGDIQDYVLTLAFILLALTSLPAYCHDSYVISAYRKILSEEKDELYEDDC